MKNWLQTLNAWRLGGYQFTPESWEQIRAKGRGRFVLRKGLTWMIILTAVMDVFTHLIYAGNGFGLWSFTFQGFVTGVFLGYQEWGENEVNYKKARLPPPVS